MALNLDSGQTDTLKDYVWNVLECVSAQFITVDKAQADILDAIMAAGDGGPALLAHVKASALSRPGR